jgi:hypothetical protein
MTTRPRIPNPFLRWTLTLVFAAAISQALLGQDPVKQHAAPSPDAGPSSEAMESFQSQMRDLRQQADACSERVREAQAALRSIKEQMADMGLDMRLDVRQAEARMTYLVDKIKAELDAGDAVSAEADLRKAGYAADFIERFLGRR